MTFTDNDLKRLKEYTISITFSREAPPWHTIEKFHALLARLEAAEIVCHAAQELIESAALMCGYQHKPGDPPAVMHLKNIDLAMKAWLKAAGK